MNYQYQIIWDYKNKIITPLKNASKRSGGNFKVSPGGNGVLINLYSASTSCGDQLFMRVIRTSDAGKTYYVDIPIVGSTVLYDNGVTLASYIWIEVGKDDPNPVLSSSFATSTKSITYVGDNLIIN